MGRHTRRELRRRDSAPSGAGRRRRRPRGRAGRGRGGEGARGSARRAPGRALGACGARTGRQDPRRLERARDLGVRAGGERARRRRPRGHCPGGAPIREEGALRGR